MSTTTVSTSEGDPKTFHQGTKPNDTGPIPWGIELAITILEPFSVRVPSGPAELEMSPFDMQSRNWGSRLSSPLIPLGDDHSYLTPGLDLEVAHFGRLMPILAGKAYWVPSDA